MNPMLLFAAMAVATIAQAGIVSDVQNESKREILSEPITYYNIKRGASFNLMLAYSEQYEQADTVKTWLLAFPLSVPSRSHMDKGQRLLLKFEDGSIREYHLHQDLTPEDFHYTYTYGLVTYHFTPYYDISEEDLLYISSHKIVKLRIEAYWNTQGYLELSEGAHLKVWSPSDAIRLSYQAIKDRLSSQPNNSIYNNF